jgi:hypothetical protein
MVEAAATIPFFIVIFVALAFVGRLYIEKQRTLALSRQQAWTFAMKNCEGSMPEVSGQDAGPIPQEGDMNFGEMKQFEGAPGGDMASKGSKMAVSTFKGKVNASTQEEYKGQTSKILNLEQKVQTTTWVTCNEKPQPGNLKGVLSTAWGIFTGWCWP